MNVLHLISTASIAVLLAGCISFSSSDAPAAPDLTGLCQQKEAQCRSSCGEAGVQHFSCKVAPLEGLEYRCDCRTPGTRT